MSGLLPHTLIESVRRHAVAGDIYSFGIVVLVVLVVLLVELEAIRVIGKPRSQLVFLTALIFPLLVAFGLIAAARMALLVR